MLSSLVAAAILSPLQDEVTTPKPGSPVRSKVLDVLRDKTKKSLHGKKVLFKVDHMKQQGDWVFFKGKGVQPNGDKFDYHGTDYQSDIDHDMFADWVCALFYRKGSKWICKTWVWGATDVAYVGWWKEYGAPKAIFPLTE
ncbi:MAG: hypothetical protein ABUL72_05230 [Armatimonadota bacterium]